MSITDELRKWITEHYTGWLSKQKDGYAIADRIDTAIQERYFELPKDANDETIHIGDVMEWVPYDSTYPSVVREVMAVGKGVFFAWSDERAGYAQYEASAYRHRRKPTVRDVLFEFAKHWVDEEEITNIDHLDPSYVQLIDDFAARLQLRED